MVGCRASRHVRGAISTGRWRDVEFRHKRAAVIEVGAAGVQVIASLASEVDHLTVFQRQAHWISRNTIGDGSELARKLMPDSSFGAKRPVRDPGDFAPGGYYYALSLPNVDLVTTPIARVVPEGIVTADGSVIELDLIVWATGMTLDWLAPIEIVGRGGVILHDVWAGNNPRTDLGGTVPRFLSLFINDGPNTGVANGGAGHNFMTETVNDCIVECLQLIVEQDATSIEVAQEAHDEHNLRIEELMADLSWTHDQKADTYYLNEAGRIILPSPFLPEDYWQMSQRPEESKFVLRSCESMATESDCGADGVPCAAPRPASVTTGVGSEKYGT